MKQMIMGKAKMNLHRKGSMSDARVTPGIKSYCRPAPIRIVTIYPKVINAFGIIPYSPNRLPGIVSSSILEPATVKMPLESPRKNLPMQIVYRLCTAIIATAHMQTTLKINRHLLLPIVIMLPPQMEPIAAPSIPNSDIKVL